MKTSTKILVVYASVLISMQLVFLANTLIQYYKLKPLAAAWSEDLGRKPIHHMVIDVTGSRYHPDTRRWDDRLESPWIEKTDGYRHIYFGANLRTSILKADTLYIDAVNDDLSWRPTLLPELRTLRIITTDGIVEKTY